MASRTGTALCSLQIRWASGALTRRGPQARSFQAAPQGHLGVAFNDHIDEPGDIVFRHACKLGFEGIVSKRLGSPYVSGRSRHWIKSKNPGAPAVKREAEEDWGDKRWR
jgi:hypothetical protein